MRRMYSQNDLEKIIKEVFLADVESGEIDFAGLIADSVEAGALEDSDVVVDTLYQKSYNYELDISDKLGSNQTGISVHSSYSKIIQVGNLLIITVNGYLQNDTESTISTVNLTCSNITLPEDLASKLYDVHGKTAHETGSGIIAGDCFILDFNASAPYFRLINTSSADQVTLNFNGLINSFTAGATRDFSGRLILVV